MATSTQKINIDIDIDAQKANKELNSIDKNLEELNKTSKKTQTQTEKTNKEFKEGSSKAGKSVGGFKASAVAAYAAIAAAIAVVSGAIKESVGLFVEQEKQSFRAQHVFGNYADEINKAADATQQLTTIGNEQYQSLAFQANAMGVANEDVNQFVQDAIGLSEKFGIAQEDALKKLIETANGNATALGEAIPEVRNFTDASEALAFAQGHAAEGFQLAQDYTQTYGGTVEQMTNTIGDLKEIIGEGVLQGLIPEGSADEAMETINDLMAALQETGFIREYIQKLIEPLTRLFGIFSDVVGLFGDSEEDINTFTVLFDGLMIAMELATTPSDMFFSSIEAIVKLLQGDFKGAINEMAGPLVDLGKAVGIVDEDFELLATTTDASLKDVGNAVNRFAGKAIGDFENMSVAIKSNEEVAIDWANSFTEVSERGVELLGDLRVAYLEDRDAFIQTQMDKIEAQSLLDFSLTETLASFKEFAETTTATFNEKVDKITTKYKKSSEEAVKDIEDITIALYDLDKELKDLTKNPVKIKLELDDIEFEDEPIEDLAFNTYTKFMSAWEVATTTSGEHSIADRGKIFIKTLFGLDDEQTEQLVGAGINAAQQLGSAIATIRQQQREQEWEAERQSSANIYESQLELAGDNAEAKEKVEQSYQRRQELLEKRIARERQQQAISQAFINGALTIGKTIAELGGVGALTPPGVAILALMAATTATQIATIKSQKFALGGVLEGPSHAQGGILTPYGELEGGEGVVNKASMSNPALRNIVSAVNQAGGGVAYPGTSGGSSLAATIDPATLDMIISKVASIPVQVVESDITRSQRKVNVIETRTKL